MLRPRNIFCTTKPFTVRTLSSKTTAVELVLLLALLRWASV